VIGTPVNFNVNDRSSSSSYFKIKLFKTFENRAITKKLYLNELVRKLTRHPIYIKLCPVDTATAGSWAGVGLVN
jgi:hypothetical protein